MGAKHFETRSRRTTHRGLVAIHAGKNWPLEDFIDLCRSPHGPPIADALVAAGHVEPHTERRTKGPYLGGVHYASTEIVHDLPLGAIVAVAEIVGCLPITDSARQGERSVVAMHEPLPGGGTQRRLWDDDGRSCVDVGDQIPFGDYTPGRWAWELANVRTLPEPVAARGAQGLWNVPPDVEASVLGQLERVEA